MTAVICAPSSARCPPLGGLRSVPSTLPAAGANRVGAGTIPRRPHWPQVPPARSDPSTTRMPGLRSYRQGMDPLRPPLLRQLRPAPWVAIDCAVTALLAPPAVVAFRELADLRGIPQLAAAAIVAVAILPAAFRRRWPRAALALVVAGSAIAMALSTSPALALAPAFVMYLIPLRRPRPEALRLLAGPPGALAGGG